jgi:beta-glucosidase
MSSRSLVDGKQLPISPHAEGQAPQFWTLDLSAGQTVNVVAEYLPSSQRHFGLGIAYEPDLSFRGGKAVCEACGCRSRSRRLQPAHRERGYDRTFTLPWGQDALIEAMAAANPRTIVTLTGGGGMDTRRWLDRFPRCCTLTIPARRAARPSPRFSSASTIPKASCRSASTAVGRRIPSAQYYFPIKGADSSLHVTEDGRPPVDYVIPHVKYDDKLMVGYRYWTTTGKHPLFPFGFGLSYTTFSFSNLKVPAAGASGSTVPVSFDVTNTGSVAGAEVAQLYVSDPSAKVSRPERELKGL